ncbi:amino acid adenylation domain-containing protein [Streptomyces lavendulae]|uniref:amino acid adenylation domain-containing protein n=1 Tax=Streptomyces lavendulae TaxID=1914 RepID=UPI0036850B5B
MTPPEPPVRVPAEPVPALMERQRRLTPDAVALCTDDEELTYAALHERADRLAAVLRGAGTGPETLVGVLLPRGTDLVVTLLAVWKAGGAWLPLDPDYPAERLRHMLADAAPAVLVTDRADAPEGPHTVVRPTRAATDDPAHGTVTPPPHTPAAPRPEQLAYVLYTSGSTGRPKGVVIGHGSLAAQLDWLRREFAPHAGEAVLYKTPFSFDASVWELLLPLTTGGRLVVARPGGHRDPDYLAALIEHRRVTTVQFVPSMLRLFLDTAATARPDALRSLRRVCCGGEALPAALAERVTRLLDVEVVNLYGPTEATVQATFARHSPAGERPGDTEAPATVPIGRPVTGATVHLLDPAGRPVPPGEPGELYIGGTAVGRGYLGRPDLTADKFVPDPRTPGGRLYRTGDLARLDADGELHYLGRLDQQIKVNGIRVEAGEIEAALVAHPQVTGAVVAVRPGPDGADRLTAWLVPAVGRTAPPAHAPSAESAAASAPSGRDLRDHLARTLPAALIPQHFVVLDRFPLSPSGKTDRAALPDPDPAAATEPQPYAAPESGTEHRVAEIWATVLGRPRVGRHDRFVDLGGNSLQATRAAVLLARATGTSVNMSEVLSAGSVAELAAALDRRPAAGRPYEPPRALPRDGGPLPLSPAQEQLWFMDQLESGTAAFHVPAALRLRGPLDTGALHTAYAGLLARHESLRTTFHTVDGRPVARVHAPAVPPPPLPVDAPEPAHGSGPATDPAASGEADGVRRWLAAHTTAPFDLATGPLFRARLLRLAEQDHILLLVGHHIVCDGLSLGVAARELSAHYRALTTPRPVSGPVPQDTAAPLPTPTLQYPDYAAWQRRALAGQHAEDRLAYWRATLDGAPQVLELPSERIRPAVQRMRGGTVRFRIDARTVERLTALARAENTTLFTALLAGYQALLARHSGRTDILVGTPVAGRTDPALEPLVGLFVNTVVLRTRLDGAPAFRELLGRVRDTCLGAYAHADVPFERVVEALAPDRDLTRQPLVQAHFVHETSPAADFRVPGLACEPVPVTTGAVKGDLRLAVTGRGGELEAVLDYDADARTHDWAEEFAEQLRLLLTGATEHPDTPVDRIGLLSEAGRRLLAATGTGPSAPPPAAVCAVDLFDAQAARTPDRTAVLSGDTRTTYGQLATRTRLLARRLAEAGVGPERLVAVCLPRGADLTAALLAVWRAGAAFVPLDPEQPPARLNAVLDSARPALLLTTAALADRLPRSAYPTRPPMLLEDVHAGADADTDPHDGTDPAGPPRPDGLAYVVHTSGSTGVPKGIAGTHRGVLNYFADLDRNGHVHAEDTVLALTTVSFDASLRDLLHPLTTGARTVVMPDGAADLVAVREALTAHRVTALPAVVPSVLRMLTAHLADTGTVLPALRTVLVSGEPLRAADAAALARVAPHAALTNMYGPSETTMTATAHRVSPPVPPADRHVPIGTPILNTRAELLDERLEPVATGVPGDVHLSGAGLTRGYHRNPALTADRFLPHPTRPGERMYRTGDRARRLPDGSLQYLGRSDDQMKVNGVRVDPADIEAALTAHPDVRRAAVALHQPADGRPVLVAHLVPPPGGTLPEAGRIRAHLAGLLPQALIPAVYLAAESLPSTTSGKTDRRALPAPPADAGRPQGPGTGRPPAPGPEQVLADIWAEVLDVHPVGADDNYFALGGDSIRSIQIVARAAAAGLHLTPRQFFQHQTVAELARAAARTAPPAGRPSTGATGTPQDPARRARRAELLAADPEAQDIHPLTPTQAGMHFHVLHEPGSGLYIGQTGWMLKDLDPDAFTRAWAALTARHPALRTSIHTGADHEPWQVIARTAQPPLHTVDGTSWPAHERTARLSALLEDDRRAAFELTRAPLFRLTLVDLGAGETFAAVTSHHLILDGWSVVRLVDEFLEAYEELRAGSCPTPETDPGWPEYLEWLAGQDTADPERFWRAYLAGFTEPSRLPAGAADPAAAGPDAGHTQRERIFAPELGERITAFARAHRLTVSTVLQAAWGLLLGQYAGTSDVVFGATVSGRSGRPGMTGTVGMFINTLPVRVTIPEDTEIVPWMRDHQQRWAALPAEHTPLVDVHGWSGVPRGVPLFDTILVVENYPMRAGLRERLDGAEAGAVSAKTWTNYPFTLVVTPGPPFRAEAVFGLGRHTPQTVDRILEHLESVLAELVEDEA